jgi:hypothetical protein
MIALQPVTWVSRTCPFVMSAGCQDRNRSFCHFDHQVLHQFSFCLGELADFLLRDTAHDYVRLSARKPHEILKRTKLDRNSQVAPWDLQSPHREDQGPFEVVGAFH